MTRTWRIILWITLALLAVGLVLAGAGWLCGASTKRIINEAFGGPSGLLAELDALKARLPVALGNLF